MTDPFDLQRFIDAQAPVYQRVLTELRQGRKQSHWMWFIFPQLAGLEHFPFSVNRRDSQGAANKILWPSRTEEAGMGYSNDLRVRVIQVVEGGAAARAAARQFVIGDSTAIRWAKRWRETGSFEAKSNKGQSRSPLKKHEEWLLALVRQEPDLTLEEIQRRLLDERQQKAGLGSVWRFFDRHGISFKKKRSGGRAGSA